jgi:pilus assembly protein TadC
VSQFALAAALACGGFAPWVTYRRVVGPAPRTPVRQRRRSADTAAAVTVDRSVLLDLVAIALAAGAPVPTALAAVGRAVGGTEGRALGAAGAALRLGASWEEAWRHCPARLGAVNDALGRVWRSGASPATVLRAAADQVRRDRRRAAREAAARLGARLVIPLGLFHLPAFILLGLVPILISLGRGLV